MLVLMFVVLVTLTCLLVYLLVSYFRPSFPLQSMRRRTASVSASLDTVVGDSYSCPLLQSMRRRIQGLRPDDIRKLSKDELDLPTSAADFDEALQKVNKSVSKGDLEKYENWMKEFGSV